MTLNIYFDIAEEPEIIDNISVSPVEEHAPEEFSLKVVGEIPEICKTFESSPFFENVKNEIETMNERLTIVSDIIRFRDFLMLNYFTHNGCRPCVVANMTLMEFNSAQKSTFLSDGIKNPCFVVLVANHKTIRKGKARVFLPLWLYELSQKYLQFIRPLETVSYEVARREVHPFFCSHSGTKVSSSTVLNAVRNTWKNAGFTC